MNNVSFQFIPYDVVFTLNNDTIKRGICLETNIKLYPLTESSSQILITYTILYDDKSSDILDSTNVYGTFSDAAEALQTILTTA